MFLFVLLVRGCTAGDRAEGGHVVMPDGSLAHIGPLVAMLRDSDATSWRRRNAVKVEAAWALHRLAGVSEADQVAIVRANAIEPLVALVRGGSSGAQEAAAAALCNLVAGGDADVLMAVVCAGAVEPLLALLGGVGNTRTMAHVLKFMSYIADNHGEDNRWPSRVLVPASPMCMALAERMAFASSDAIEPRFALVRSGIAVAQKYAATALRNLADNINAYIMNIKPLTIVASIMLAAIAALVAIWCYPQQPAGRATERPRERATKQATNKRRRKLAASAAAAEAASVEAASVEAASAAAVEAAERDAQREAAAEAARLAAADRMAERMAERVAAWVVAAREAAAWVGQAPWPPGSAAAAASKAREEAEEAAEAAAEAARLAASAAAAEAASAAAAAPVALDRPTSLPVAATSLADAQFDTGRPEAPESTIGGEMTCIVCFVNLKSHVAVPCGHQCACAVCSAQMNECPVCRTPVSIWTHVRVV